jgi:Metallo-peptidase family M12
MRIVSTRVVILSAVFAAFVAFPSSGASVRQLDRRIVNALASVPEDGKVTLRDLPLGRESLDHIELEPMQVWADDAKIVVFGADGQETIIRPPDIRYFKGRVVGEADSAVFFSRSADGSVRGAVMLGERRWTIATGIRATSRPGASVRLDLGERPAEGDAPLLITEVEAIDDSNPVHDWACEVGTHAPGSPVPAIGENLRANVRGIEAQRGIAAETGNVSGAAYTLRLGIETDNELATAFGNNAGSLTTYIGDLIGKASVVYSRDLNTTLIVGHTNLRTGGAGTDPWTQTSSSAALAEFGTYWHNNYGGGGNYPDPDGGGAGKAGAGATVQRSSAVFLSGKLTSAGIAWVDVLCDNDFFCGTTGANCNGGVASATWANQYAGAYAFNGSSGSVSTTTPDPTLTVNGVQYGIPNSNFWMLLEVMHELGHNVASPHSSCVALSAGEQVLYGVARSFVDICLSGGTGCYSGATSAPTEKGTIMSYCHNITVSGFRASRYLFGKAGEASEKMLPIFKYGQGLDPNAPTGLEGCTANPTITVQTEPVSCSAGRTASVTACGGCTYSWQITGGTITSSSTIAAITYTPTQTNVTLTVTVTSARGCAVTAPRVFLSSCVAVLAPANVVATATSTAIVNVSWLASVGATSYNVYRSADAVNYALAGTTATLSLNDGGRTANTAYLYKVRAVNGGESADSNIDLATTTIFTDDPLVVAATLVKAAHLTELRTAVNAVRAILSLGNGSYTDPAITATVTPVRAAHVTDLRTALDTARTALSLSSISYGESITATSTTIKASHFTELRNGVK